MPWKLAYANDPDGNRTAGNERALIRGARKGRPVRVLMDFGVHQYVADAECLWVKQGHVYAQNTSHVSSEWDGTVLKFQESPYYWMTIASTAGDLDFIRWNLGKTEISSRDHQKIAMKWFVG
ncbi:MAG: hypothetical protein GY854_15360 [Deltaproteobacteria bacterium]|nr:hypothetical protein [Deltaproteobacteria bacterium]